MHKGSRNNLLSELSVGEKRYIETTLAGYASDMRAINTPKSRRPQSLSGREFKTSLFTAISAGKTGDVRYLVCVERVS